VKVFILLIAVAALTLGSAVPAAAAAPTGFSCSIGKGGFIGTPGGSEWVDFIKFCTSFGGHPQPF